MAGKLKVDLSGVKSFFVDKGEKIALALCVLAAVLLIAIGVLDAASVRTAPGSSKPYGEALQTAAASLKDQVDRAPVNEKAMLDPERIFKKVRYESELANLPYQFGDFFGIPETGNSKRKNPSVVPILAGADTVAMSYIPGTYFSYDIDASKAKQTIVVYEPAANPNAPAPVVLGKKNQAINAHPAIITRPMRMVVVNCVFPMREQLKVFMNAFQMQSQAELFSGKDHRDLPMPLGLNIYKAEVIAGKQPDFKPFVVATAPDANGDVKMTIDPALRRIFREALLDDENIALNYPYLLQGLAMPLPKLAILPTGQYPTLKLNGLEVDEDAVIAAPAVGGGDRRGMRGMAGGGDAMGGMAFNPFGGQGNAGGGGMMGGGKDLVRADVPWKMVSKDLQDKLHDRTNILDPKLVNFDPPEEDQKDANGVPIAPVPQNFESFLQGNSQFSAKHFWDRYPKPAGVNVAGVAPKKADAQVALKPYDALVRFIDPTVEPGKTYQYWVQVRMANPNFGRKDEVAFPALAERKELDPSQLVETPTITIPDEYYFYAVDQKPAFKVKGGSDWEAPKETTKQEHIAVQIHRWVDEAKQVNGANPAIGDWCIAERIYVRRGDPIGKPVNVEVPVWDSETNRFALAKAAGAGAAPKVRQLVPPKNPAVVAGTGIEVNFAVTNPAPILVDFDGGRRYNGTKLFDESASNVLILRADGTLVVRNTRTDSEEVTPQGKERMQRIETWKTKTAPLRFQAGNPFNPPPGAGGLFGPKRD